MNKLEKIMIGNSRDNEEKFYNCCAKFDIIANKNKSFKSKSLKSCTNHSGY